MLFTIILCHFLITFCLWVHFVPILDHNVSSFWSIFSNTIFSHSLFLLVVMSFFNLCSSYVYFMLYVSVLCTVNYQLFMVIWYVISCLVAFPLFVPILHLLT